jgi:hypothetical protein
VTLPPIIADARKAGWENLSDKRNTLGRVLLNAEEEYGEDNKAAARTDPEKSRSEPPRLGRPRRHQTNHWRPIASSERSKLRLSLRRPDRRIGQWRFCHVAVDRRFINQDVRETVVRFKDLDNPGNNAREASVF